MKNITILRDYNVSVAVIINLNRKFMNYFKPILYITFGCIFALSSCNNQDRHNENLDLAETSSFQEAGNRELNKSIKTLDILGSRSAYLF